MASSSSSQVAMASFGSALGSGSSSISQLVGTALPCRIPCEGAAWKRQSPVLLVVAAAAAAAGRGNAVGGHRSSSSATVISVVENRVAADEELVVRRKSDALHLQIRTEEEEEDVVVAAPPVKSGGLIDNKLLYREKFMIRCYEVGTNGTASMETMANLLQEVACNHAQSVGFSTDGFATTPLMRQKHLIWVTTRMHIQMKNYPVWGDIVEIDTWYQGEGRIETRRDWIIRDDRTGDVIGRATSTWVMMNMMTRRLSRIPDDVRQEFMPFVPIPPRWAFDPNEENNSSVRRIASPDMAQFERSNLMPRRNDLDMNQHVNNVTYVCWMLEAIPLEVSSNYELAQITLDYKRECKADDVVESLVTPENNETAAAISWLMGPKHTPVTSNETHLSLTFLANGSHTSHSSEPSHPTLLFLHVLRLSNEGKEINRGRTEWRRKPKARGKH